MIKPLSSHAQTFAKFTVQPYPNQYAASFMLANGEQVTVRAIQPEDEPLIIALHGRHSEHTIRMRFFSLVKVLSRDSLIRLCHLDYDRVGSVRAHHVQGPGPGTCPVRRAGSA